MLTAAGAHVTEDDPLRMTQEALIPVLEPKRRNSLELARAEELLITVALDGDRAANHLYHWLLDDAYWTPAAALAAIGFYGLPHDPKTGLLEPALLFDAIDRAVTSSPSKDETGTLRDAVRRDAPKSLAGPCLTQLTIFDAEMYDRHPTNDLTDWAVKVSPSKHAKTLTRWRHVQYLVVGDATKGKSAVGF